MCHPDRVEGPSFRTRITTCWLQNAAGRPRARRRRRRAAREQRERRTCGRGAPSNTCHQLGRNKSSVISRATVLFKKRRRGRDLLRAGFVKKKLLAGDVQTRIGHFVPRGGAIKPWARYISIWSHPSPRSFVWCCAGTY